MNNKLLKNMSLSAMFLAVGLMLPLFTGQIPQIGNMLLPMHFPVFLCGLICGWKYGLLIGAVLPILRSAIFGMPMMYPTAVAMAFELAAYGFISGYLYNRSKWQCVIALYKSLFAAMIGGRLVWAAAQVILLSVNGGAFTFQMFIAGAFMNAIPGILLQLVLIPAIMVALDKSGLVYFKKTNEEYRLAK